MKLNTRHDIEVPIAFVWQYLTDFRQFELLAARRGAHIEHRGSHDGLQEGRGWQLEFRFRGKLRKALVTLTGLVPRERLDFGIDSPSLAGGARLELLALSANRTRLSLVSDVKPRTLAARLVIQTLRLAKGRTQRKYDSIGEKLARQITENWRSSGR